MRFVPGFPSRLARRSRPLRAAAMAAAGLALAACAGLQAFSPDPQARAPHLEGYGRIDPAARTRSPETSRLFDDAVLQAYAFNEVAAVRGFKAALARDPDCVPCAWGVAWQLGPNINDHDRDKVPEALRYVDYALQRADRATPRDRELLQALALRYAHASQARETAPLLAARCGKGEGTEDATNPLDQAYADRMRAIADRYPDDPDVLSLYAEAEIIATPGDFPWDEAGKPEGRMGDLTNRLERLLAQRPDHTGLNHYMVHALDARSVAARATAAADRLGRLAPASPHLLHMPAHIYVWTGRFDDAVAVNRQALAADAQLAAAEKAQGFEPSKDWRGHDSHFMWYAGVMAGRQDDAMEAARALALTVGSRKDAFAEYVLSIPLLTLVRFEQWDAVLREPQPAGTVGVSRLWWEHARGIAQARLGREAQARESLTALRTSVAGIRGADPAAVPKRRLAMADYALARLEAEIALAAHDLAGATAKQEQAVKAAEVLEKAEPPWLADGALLGLAEIQARGRQFAAAEATYRKSLAERPGNVWAVRGLERLRTGVFRAG